MKTSYDLIVIGAGISGLSMAYYAALKGVKVLVCEKSHRPGGCVNTWYPKQAPGFWLELGTHTIYNSYQNLLEIMEQCQLSKEIVKREKTKFLFLKDNQLESILSQLNIIELMYSIPSLITTSKKGLTLKGYYTKIIGDKNYNKLLSCAFSAILSQSADNFPADMLFNKRKKNKHYPRSFTLKNGLSSMTEAIVNKQKFSYLQDEVCEIQKQANTFIVKTQLQHEYFADKVAFATPPQSTAKLVSHIYPDLSLELRKIKQTNINSIGVVVKKDQISLPPLTGIIPARNDSFYSVVSRDCYPHNDYRGFAFHFKPDQTNQQQINRIYQVLKIRKEHIVAMSNEQNRLPMLGKDHHQILEGIKSKMTNQPIYLCGNYFNGFAVEDCINYSKSQIRQ